ncbi:hypothetical protein [Bradyrhizobium sp.]|jgi:hypothetical protein|uniref:hypothetical protein n=1 Tax=Bradyrhizobium sp. TaxID=376 RepID=UPI003C28D25A
MAKVVSVNVGLPLELAWRGKMVRTAIWKRPVDGRLYARRLNLVGDGQADLAAHGTGSRAAIFTSLQKSEKRSKFLRRVIAEEYCYLSKIVPPPYVFLQHLQALVGGETPFTGRCSNGGFWSRKVENTLSFDGG